MQQDALERLNLRQMLLEPEMLEAVEPDVHLVATALASSGVHARQDARDGRALVVRKVVEDLSGKLARADAAGRHRQPNRAARNRRPRHNEIDWNRTIRANLKHYQPEYQTIIPETRIGFGPQALARCATSSSASTRAARWRPRSSTPAIFGAVLASLPAVATQMVVFDTAVVDLTEELHDPVELLFGTQLGGGTDINRALAYCQGLIRQPAGDDPGADQRPLRGRRPRGDAQARRRAGRLRRADDRPAGPQRRRRARLRPRNAAALAALGVPGLRLHARPVPGPDGRRHPAPRHRRLGRRARHRHRRAEG